MGECSWQVWPSELIFHYQSHLRGKHIDVRQEILDIVQAIHFAHESIPLNYRQNEIYQSKKKNENLRSVKRCQMSGNILHNFNRRAILIQHGSREC